MNRINEMIREFCPNGIKTVPLWKYTAWDKKFNAVDNSMQKSIIKYKYLLANKLNEIVDNTGDIRILYTSEEVAYTTEEKAGEFISQGEIVAIPWGGNPNVKYYNGRFVTGDNRIATSIAPKILDTKFLYYVLLNKLDIINTFYRGAGIKHPSMFSVLTLEIPLPPLNIQKEIVSILDSFTSLIDKMKQEVEMRKKQMEYYLNILICKDNVAARLFGDIGVVQRGKRVVRKELALQGCIPVFQNSLTPLGYYQYSNIPANNTFIISAGTAGEIGFSAKPFWAADDCLVISSVLCDSKYLYYYLKTQEQFLKSQIRGGAMKRLSRETIEKLEIPVPSLEKQRQIVSILDTFETYISKLEKMIELRQKQYEYYREKLLTFE
ncbi:restriction endonuclease subunit S [Segatella copri]|uniref:restriction endonuclease subunit S n=1 Tax=Segatella copri TaxID=165179 RepID=UPI001C445C05|nr:restriction endonuclease subunit S [Segatella copri]MBW0031574.1 restriction endonuclease subunit S [Segatella copri]